MSRQSALLILPLWIVLGVPELRAVSSYLNLARQRYPRISGMRLDTCSLCHTSGSSLNVYGQDYRNNRRDFAAVEALDSDGDGFSNIAEINALTFPGTRTDLPQSVLHFPVTVSTADRATGFAVTNTGSSRATVVLSVYQNSGQPVESGAGVTTYRVLDMAAHSQTANLATELFGGSLQLDGGWVRLASAQSGVTGFYLTFDNRKSPACCMS